MKLLLDENLSRNLCRSLSDFGEVSHVAFQELIGVDDAMVWQFAAENGFVVLSKDRDFADRVVLQGPPPKVIWLRIGNASTADVARTLSGSLELVMDFVDSEAGLLVLPAGLETT